jgi:hypothetical protein
MLHDRYTWQVHTVTLDKVQETLDGITLATYEVYTTHLLQANEGLPPQLMIIARQHGDVFKTISEDKMDAQVRGWAKGGTPVFRMWARAPSSGVYKTKCGHVEQYKATRGEDLPPCGRCQRDVEWALIKAD